MDLQAVREWYQEAPGKLALESERNLLNQYIADILGQHILQIDILNDERLLNASPIKHKVRVNTSITAGITGSVVAADLMELPFLPNSVDAAVVNHVLGFVEQPQLLLKELEAMLKSEGYLIIIGFNPFSMWGLIKLYANLNLPPWQEKFIPALKLRYWLNKLGFSIVNYRTALFRPPLENAAALKKINFMEATGELYFPNLGAIYILLAQKKRIPLSLIPYKQKRQKSEIATGVLKPSTRTQP